MPRAGLGPDGDCRWRVRRELPGGLIEGELVDPVVAERGRQDVAVGGIDHDRMRVRVIRQHLLRRLHGAGRPDRVHGDLVARVRRAQQVAARAVGGDVRHAVGEQTAGDVLEGARGGVDGEAGRDLRLAAGAHVQEAPVGADRHGRRDAWLVDAGDRHLLDELEVAARPIEAKHVDLVALRVTDVDERGSAHGGGHQRPRDRGQQHQPGPLYPVHGRALPRIRRRRATCRP